MKRGRWELFNAPITADWVIKKLCRVKEKPNNWMKSPKYFMEVVYKDLLWTANKVRWADTVWNRAVIPRSRFVVWPAYHERLKTKQRLKRVGWWRIIDAPYATPKPKR